jgi:hypothetical protein
MGRRLNFDTCETTKASSGRGDGIEVEDFKSKVEIEIDLDEASAIKERVGMEDSSGSVSIFNPRTPSPQHQQHVIQTLQGLTQNLRRFPHTGAQQAAFLQPRAR